MRTFSLLSIPLLTLGLAACSGGAQNAQPTPTEPAAQQEQQAVPVVDSTSSAASADHIDDPNEPAHGHSSSHDDSNLPPHRD